MQKPSVGQIVHYHFARSATVVTRPAVIVRVWPESSGGPDMVNLQVFFDGSNDGINAGDMGWRTSVHYGEPPADGNGISSPTWSWPPHVPSAAPKTPMPSAR